MPKASMEPLPKERSDDVGQDAGRVAWRASMEPLPKERSDGEFSFRPVDGVRASMEPLPKERSDAPRTRCLRPVPLTASMEPLPKERSDGSPKTSHLTCENATVCEHLPKTIIRSTHYAVLKIQKHPLTCMRALPGV